MATGNICVIYANLPWRIRVRAHIYCHLGFTAGATGRGGIVIEKAFATMSDRQQDKQYSGSRDVAVEEARPKLKRPPLFRVILVNDDFTPMEFVVEILQGVFSMERTSATRVMLEVHTKGKGVCGEYTFEIAETKVAQVTTIAQQQQHPLLCTMEEL